MADSYCVFAWLETVTTGPKSPQQTSVTKSANSDILQMGNLISLLPNMSRPVGPNVGTHYVSAPGRPAALREHISC